MNGPHTAPGWCQWHHAEASTLAPIAVAPVIGGQDLYACAECCTTYRLVPAVDMPVQTGDAATAAVVPTSGTRLVTPCAGGGHDFPVEDERGAYCPEHGAEVQRTPQPACEPHPLIRALAGELTGTTTREENGD